MTSDKQVHELLSEILVWIRASSYRDVKAMLEGALTDEKERLAYQMLDGEATHDSVKKSVQLGSERMVALIVRCTAMGLMRRSDGPAKRLFDLIDFGMLPTTMADKRKEKK